MIKSLVSFGQDANWWRQQGLSLLIVNLPADPLIESAFLIKLRADLPRETPLLLLVDTISSPVLQLTTAFDRVRLLKRPFESPALYRSVLDAITDRAPGTQQMFPRYQTDYPVTIQRGSQQVPAAIRNISIGGAYFETRGQMGIAPTDDVHIKLTLPNGSNHEFSSRVVWVRDLPQGQGCGCTFREMDQVYHQILKGF